MTRQRHRYSATGLGAVLLLALAGCGQKGPLYLPDKRPVAVPATPVTAPASQPAQEPVTRKAPPAPAPATAR
ncbi:MAG: lipoprotein [Gammaproteobacteria bacterium]|nr:lipoprotein [Gammaproteobacteria bacterium]